MWDAARQLVRGEPVRRRRDRADVVMLLCASFRIVRRPASVPHRCRDAGAHLRLLPARRAGVGLAGIMRIGSMLRRTVAALLLVLTALPFTAPFATCDVPTLLGTPSPIVPSHASVASVEDGSHTVPLYSSSIRIRIRLEGLAHREVIGHAHRSAVPGLDAAALLSASPHVSGGSSTVLRI